MLNILGHALLPGTVPFSQSSSQCMIPATKMHELYIVQQVFFMSTLLLWSSCNAVCRLGCLSEVWKKGAPTESLTCNEVGLEHPQADLLL